MRARSAAQPLSSGSSPPLAASRPRPRRLRSALPSIVSASGPRDRSSTLARASAPSAFLVSFARRHFPGSSMATSRRRCPRAAPCSPTAARVTSATASGSSRTRASRSASKRAARAPPRAALRPPPHKRASRCPTPSRTPPHAPQPPAPSPDSPGARAPPRPEPQPAPSRAPSAGPARHSPDSPRSPSWRAQRRSRGRRTP